MQISANSLAIRNPICQVVFNIEVPAYLGFTKPKTGGEAPELPGSGAQFGTRLIGLRVETTYFALRAQARDGSRYREWCSRLVGDGREWFEK
jgi:hypothetical protein